MNALPTRSANEPAFSIGGEKLPSGGPVHVPAYCVETVWHGG